MLASTKDFLNILSKFTLRRAANAGAIVIGYWISKIFKRPYVFGFPASVSIEPTTSCNLRCPECPSGLRSFSRETGMLDENFYQRIIDQIHLKVMYLIFYFQGEPFLNPSFLKMVRYAASKNIYTATSTNAHYLDDETARQTVESGLDRLIISIDGTTQEVYEKYRIGGKLEKVLAGTKNVISWKKKLKSQKPQVVFQFLVVKPNEHQLEDARMLAKECGVDKIVFKTAQIYDFENGSDLIPDNEKYSRYKIDSENKFHIKNKMLNHCWRLWHSSVITWDGKMLPCCFDKDANYKLGDLASQTFEEVWNSPEYNEFRQSILHSRKDTDICTNCSEGLKVFS